jgi:hypothetical protein
MQLYIVDTYFFEFIYTRYSQIEIVSLSNKLKAFANSVWESAIRSSQLQK